jgi:hypothetical protein
METSGSVDDDTVTLFVSVPSNQKQPLKESPTLSIESFTPMLVEFALHPTRCAGGNVGATGTLSIPAAVMRSSLIQRFQEKIHSKGNTLRHETA